jgi:2-(1,2-epoxy-1,2-dihydrophenyl)acetyl-CoA isomerase
MTGERIDFSIADDVARIVLANPANRNAIDAAFVHEFAGAAGRCEAERALRAIVISARGDWFSAGGDLRSFLAHRDAIGEHVRRLAGTFHTSILALRRAAAPVIAAVGGMAAGGGFSLVCGADLVVASEAARFVSAYTSSGLTPDGGGTFFLPHIVGRRVAFDLMATNPVLSAQEAKALGIVSRVVAPEALDEAVEALVAQLAGLPEGAVAGLKALLRRGEDEALTTQLQAEAESIARLAASPATLLRMEQFLTRKSR